MSIFSKIPGQTYRRAIQFGSVSAHAILVSRYTRAVQSMFVFGCFAILLVVSGAEARAGILEKFESGFFVPQSQRRMGIEIELTGLSTKQIAEKLQEILGGKLEAREHVVTYQDESGLEKTKVLISYKLKRSEVSGGIIIKPESNAISTAEFQSNADSTVISEIVTDPILYADVIHLQKAISALQIAGAKGTDRETAVSIQVNIEIAEGDRRRMMVSEVLNILRTYLNGDNYQQIQSELDVPEIRKPYLGKFQPGFMKRLQDPHYRPSWKSLYVDFMYRQGLEMSGDVEAWTISEPEASDRMRQQFDARGFEFVLPVMKWNHIKVSSLLMYLFPDEWLTRKLVESLWIKPIPVLEFRDPNNDFQVAKVARQILGLTEGSEILGPLTSEKLDAGPEAKASYLAKWSARATYLNEVVQNPETQAVYAQVENYFSTLPADGWEKARAQEWWRYDQPLLLSQADIELIKKGTEQRAQAIQAFLRDHFSGDRRYARTGMFDLDLIDRALQETRMDKNDAMVDPRNFSFWYGPDLIKDVKGRFVILEDNMTMTTGFDAVGMTAKNVFDSLPVLRGLVVKPQKNEFYENMMAEYQRIASGRKIVLVRYYVPEFVSKRSSKARSYDEHWKLIAKRLEPYGVSVVEVLPGLGSSGMRNAVTKEKLILKSSAEGVRLIKTDTHGNRTIDDVGYVLVGLLNREIYRWAVPGLLDAFKAGRVGMNQTAGVELFDSKQMYTQVDSMIRYYLRQEPVFRSLKTRHFHVGHGGNPLGLDQVFFNQVFAELGQWVIKDTSSASCGGSGVLIGAKQSGDTAEIERFKRAIQKDPQRYYAQEYSHPSVHECTYPSGREGRIFDLRPISAVTPQSVITSLNLVSRTALISGTGKTNYSADPKSVKMGAVLVVDSGASAATARHLYPNSCENLAVPQRSTSPSVAP